MLLTVIDSEVLRECRHYGSEGSPATSGDPSQEAQDDSVIQNKTFHQKGFTLLELLIVIFIIAIIVSVATLALGDMGKNRKAGYFAEQLKSTLAYAQQYAVIQPTTVIFELDNNHYQFKALQMIAHDNGSITYRWKALNNPGSRDGNAPDYVTLQMKSKDSHSIQINSSGTMTPFSMHIGVSGEDSYYLLNGNAAGVLTLTKQSGDNS